MKILIIEDDSKIASFIVKGFKESGLHAESVDNGKAGLDILLTDPTYDLLVLDLMLPGMDGLRVLSELKSAGHSLPVLILSAKRSVHEKVEGLQHGADDYLEKPFAFSELLARVQALLRRHQPAKEMSPQITECGITLDLIKREVTREGQTIELQAKEFALLEYLMKNPGRVLSKTLILENVYHYNFDTQTNIVDVLVCRLRNKVDKNFKHKTIHTIRGLGYVLKQD